MILLPVRAVSRSLLKGNVMSAIEPVVIDETVAGATQAYVAGILTPEIIERIQSGADSGIEEAAETEKSEAHVKALADLLAERKVHWYQVTRKAPKGVTETPEDQNKREELVRQIEGIMTKRMEYKRPKMGSDNAFELEVAVKNVNEARKQKGLSKLNAPLCAEQGLGGITPTMLKNRNKWSNIKSVYWDRLVKYLKAHEPKPVKAETDDTASAPAESAESAPKVERTFEQSGVIKLIEAYKSFVKAPASSKVDATVHVLSELIAQWGQPVAEIDLDAE